MYSENMHSYADQIWKLNVQTVSVFFWTLKSNEVENGSVETG